MKFFLLAAALATTPALAQHAGHGTHGVTHGQVTAADPYAASMAEMHERMGKAAGADASETWVRQMIEHHRGAVAMSAHRAHPRQGPPGVGDVEADHR